MKRWLPAILWVAVASLFVLFSRSSSPGLLADTDTKVILETIRERHNPWSWFVGDWPLQNHFYRPISTLFFELDNALYGNNAAGYGLTNALLGVAGVWLLFWFFRELTDSPWMAGLSASLFGWWLAGGSIFFANTIALLGWITLVIGAIRHRRNWQAYVIPGLALFLLAWESAPIYPLNGRTIQWIPGRTATVMALFCLIACASYARYERLRGKRSAPPAITPLTPPATRNTVVEEPLRSSLGWALLALVSVALALGSYEQAVMLPACLLAVAVTFRWRGYRPAWGWQGGFWSLLVGYLLLRKELLPVVTSGYQKQQLRFGPGVWLDLGNYLAEPLTRIRTAMSWDSWLILFDHSPWGFAAGWLTFLAGAYLVWKRRSALAVAGWGLSIIAFLPMAWLKLFEHYHYWPLAMRSLLVSGLVSVILPEVLTALSPPTRQAPPRPTPAPGSLPRQ